MSGDRTPISERLVPGALLTLVGERISVRRSGGTFTGSCPHPAHSDSTPSFTVKGERARCYGCGWAGDAVALLQWLDGLSFRDALEELRRRGLLRDDDTVVVPQRYHRTASLPQRDSTAITPASPLPDTRRPAPEVAARLLERYLEERQWPAHAAERFGLEVVLDRSGHPRVRHPYLVPSPAGPVMLTYQDRASSQRSPKWLNPSGRPLTLWNLHELRDDTEVVVLTEGPADGITAAVALEGHPQCTVLGIPGSQIWERRSSEWAPLFTGLTVVLAVDSDTAGASLRDHLVASLAHHARRLTEVRLRGAKDLHEMWLAAGPDTVREVLLEAAGITAAVECPNGWDDPGDDPGDEPTMPSPSRCAVCAAITDGARYCPGCSTVPWRVCGVCGEYAARTDGSPCVMTPGCTGMMVREAVPS